VFRTAPPAVTPLTDSEFPNQNSSSNHVQLRSVRDYGVCSLVTCMAARDIVMPIVRFMTWVGTSLLALLFAADWYLPNPLPKPAGDAINRPVIRIASVQQPPERVIIDTSQPTIVPPPTLFTDAAPSEPSPVKSYASAGPPPMIVDVGQKKRKISKRQGPKLASNQLPFASTPEAETPVPLTKLSFTDVISGVKRSLFNLH
jgi:hypothetical protein